MVHIGRMESGGGEYGVSNIRDKFDSIVGEVEECERVGISITVVN